VFKYYYIGCVSWSWYYPYHYAPMASDFVNIDTFEIKFDQSAPLRPFEQLMGVLPAARLVGPPQCYIDFQLILVFNVIVNHISLNLSII
jgi:5'-3' exonuclease